MSKTPVPATRNPNEAREIREALPESGVVGDRRALAKVGILDNTRG